MDYELIIIGGGPAGAAAAVYAARKQIKTALVTDGFGGQSMDSDQIQNWVGTISISGLDLAKNLREHVKAYADGFVDIKEGERVKNVEHIEQGGFLVTTGKDIYKTKTVLVTAGGARRKLDIPGAKELEGKGISYCASCDGPFYADKDVVVVGGGNAGFETASQLLAYCKSVTLMSRGDFKADPVTVEKVIANPKMKAITNAIPTAVKGGPFVKSLIYKRTAPFAVDNIEIKADGIFVEIGHVPSTSFVKDMVYTDEFGRIKTDPKTQRTSKEGIWAAGDCTDVLYHQNNIAAGDAVKALEDIYLELQRMK